LTEATDENDKVILRRSVGHIEEIEIEYETVIK
jgi:hypothetical protein